MATASTEESLELLLSKATNVLGEAEDWEAIVRFCDRVIKDLDGPQNAVRLFIHKIQSPQEKEALLALTTLEACVKNCGRRFQQEIGKFRFLNEIIKLISPKFVGNFTPAKVKQKCTELLYYWSEVLTHEPKIKEAYMMLRRQGIVKQDPVISDWKVEVVSPPQAPPTTAPPTPTTSAGNSIFEDEEKSKMLSRLLRSKNPDDLMAANRLIKNMVKQDAERTEKVSLRIQQLDIVYNNVKLLNEMLQNYRPGLGTQSDKEIMKELFDNLEQYRPKLFQLASEADESDESGIAEVLKANDEVLRVSALYEDLVVKADVVNLLEDTPESASKSDSNNLIAAFSLPPAVAPADSTDLLISMNHSGSRSILDDQLERLGLGGISLTNGFDSQASLPNATHTELTDLADTFLTNNVQAVQPVSLDSSRSALNRNVVTNLSNCTNSPLPVPPLQPIVANALTQPNLNLHTLIQPTNASTHPNLHTLIQPTNASTHPNLHTLTQPPSTTFQHVPYTAQIPGLYDPSPVPSMQAAFQPSVSPGMTRPLFPSSTLPLQPNVPQQPVLPLQPIVPLQPNVSLQPIHASPVKTAGTITGLESLDEIGRSALLSSITSTSSSGVVSAQTALISQSKVPMNQMTKVPQLSAASGTVLPPSTAGDASAEVLALTDIFVPLETIKPGGVPPVVVYDKQGLKIMFHFGKDRPRPDVLVVAVSIVSTNESPVKGFVFQAAVPKVMKIKLQPASATDLPAYNPILPLAAITQVMLVAHRPQDKILLRFKITYSLNDALTTDVGDVQFTSS